jgi:dihydrofolate reductase
MATLLTTRGTSTGQNPTKSSTSSSQVFAAGLVDECHLFLNPIVVGSGNRALPSDRRVDLELLDERRFGNGVVHLHYRVTN